MKEAKIVAFLAILKKLRYLHTVFRFFWIHVMDSRFYIAVWGSQKKDDDP